MKAIGMARRVDQLGRVVLPAELRRLFGIREGDLLEIFVEDTRIVLAKVTQRCVFCSSGSDLRPFKDRAICAACIATLNGG